jgi:hypothetical protein
LFGIGEDKAIHPSRFEQVLIRHDKVGIINVEQQDMPTGTFDGIGNAEQKVIHYWVKRVAVRALGVPNTVCSLAAKAASQGIALIAERFYGFQYTLAGLIADVAFVIEYK